MIRRPFAHRHDPAHRSAVTAVTAAAAAVAVLGCGALGCNAPATDPIAATAADVAASAAWVKRVTADCPTYHQGAKVLIDDIAGGVRVTITTDLAPEVADVRADAAYLVGASEAGAGADALDFGGHTGRRHLNCAIVLDGTRIASREVHGGVVMDVTALDPTNEANVRRLARERDENRALMRRVMEEQLRGRATP